MLNKNNNLHQEDKGSENINKKNSTMDVKKSKWLLLPILLIIITFSAALNYGFVSDDHAFLIDNSNLLSQPIKEYFQKGVWEFSTFGENRFSSGQLYRPLALLNYRIQSLLWEGNPMGFHLTNIVAHILVSILVFFLLALLIPTASGKSLALATSIFGIHPAQVESVCWIMGSNDVWAALWSFLGIFLLLIKSRNHIYLTLVSMAAIFAAMLTKEVAYTIPGLVAILLFIRKQNYNLKKIAFLTSLSAIVLIITLFLRNSAVQPSNLDFTFSGVKNALIYFLGYVKMTILPYPQRFYFRDPAGGMVAYWEMIIGIVGIICFCFLLWKKKKGRYFLILSAGWFLIILTPALAVSFHAVRHTFSSRLLYLAIFSFSMIVLWLLSNLNKRKRLVEGMIMVIIIIFMGTSIWTSFSWKNQGSFIKLALDSTPEHVALYVDLGDFYIENNKMDKAIQSYNHVISSNSKISAKILAHERLGEVYGKEKSYKKALIEYEAILRLDPKNSNANVGFGNISWLSGDLHTAKIHYEKALQYNANNIIAKNNLASVNNILATNLIHKTEPRNN